MATTNGTPAYTALQFLCGTCGRGPGWSCTVMDGSRRERAPHATRKREAETLNKYLGPKPAKEKDGQHA